MIPAYPKIFHLGRPETSTIFDGPIVIEEKVDGSQFAIGTVNGALACRSKGQMIDLDNPPKMFRKAVDHARLIEPEIMNDWDDGRSFYFEYLERERHNSLTYSRVPKGNLVLFGVRFADGTFEKSRHRLADTANDLSCEVVPALFEGDLRGDEDRVNILEFIDKLLEGDSFLGGAKIEGVVVKNYGQMAEYHGMYGPLQAKFVSEAFKELHSKNQEYMPRKDILETLGMELATPARWQKAIQRATEEGVLLGEPKDIGGLVERILKDVEEEEGARLRDAIWKSFGKKILQRAIVGFPQWYKEQLVTNTFGALNETPTHTE